MSSIILLYYSSINMSRGIFQGCSISPFLFVFAIEVLAIAIRSNDDIKGIQVKKKKKKKKISLLADDTTRVIPPVFCRET